MIFILYCIAVALFPLMLESFVKTKNKLLLPRNALSYLSILLFGLGFGLGILALIPYPLTAFTVYAAVLILITIISNIKLSTLKMVYSAHDIENVRHLFLYPDFYIVHIGALKTAIGFVVAGAALTLLLHIDVTVLPASSIVPQPLIWLGGCFLWFILATATLHLGKIWINENSAHAYNISGKPNADTERFGLFGSIFLHLLLARDKRHIDALGSKYKKNIAHHEEKNQNDLNLPNIIAVQGESFFNLERLPLSPPSSDNIWHKLDDLKQKGTICQNLTVPAWGAYTMQTEMAFLTSIPESAYKSAHINPYRTVGAQNSVWSIAWALKEAGYETICIHPAKKGFFRRHKTMPNLGFDHFLSIKDFQDAPKFGPYIADKAISDRVKSILDQTSKPVFIFAITIESHGPWQKGRLEKWIDETAAFKAEPTADQGFALYRQHMENLLTLFDDLITMRTKNKRDRVLALYGDHMPALAPLFQKIGFTEHATDYLMAVIKNGSLEIIENPGPLDAVDLGLTLLKQAGFKVTDPKN